ncbi:MAG: hypothetical protein K2X69_00945 [Silvanigrellaceae bacterium]|nr:hypothetical protein [Silvanigrellaceae bacterium]
MCNRVPFFIIVYLFSECLYGCDDIDNQSIQSSSSSFIDKFFDASFIRDYVNENHLSRSQVNAQYGKHHFAHVLLGVVAGSNNIPESQKLLSNKNFPIRYYPEEDLILQKDHDYLIKFLEDTVVCDIKSFGFYYQSLKKFAKKEVSFINLYCGSSKKICHNTFPLQKYRYYLARVQIDSLDKVKSLGWQEYSPDTYKSDHYDAQLHEKMILSIHDSMQNLKKNNKSIFSGSGKVLHFSQDIPKELQQIKSEQESFFNYRHTKKKVLEYDHESFLCKKRKKIDKI